MKTSRGNHVVHLGNSAATKRSHPTRNGRGKQIKGGKKRGKSNKNSTDLFHFIREIKKQK
jgi:hypothetical protein